MRKDSWWLGLAAGLMWSGAGLLLWVRYEQLTAWLGPFAERLQPPVIQLLLLAPALLLFRFMMVRWNMIRTAKGMFLMIFAAAMMAFLNHRYHFY